MARNRPAAPLEDHRQRIMDAAEAVLRRHGPGKTNVVDVARELGQSHASVYRYFASKAALVDALARRWLARVLEPLDAIVRSEGPAADRLLAWLWTLHRAKVGKVRDDPELFAAFQAIAAESPEAVEAHMTEIVGQVASIIADGVASGEFAEGLEPARAARAVLNGSVAFHHPRFLAGPDGVRPEGEAADVFALLIAGLRAGPIG